MSQENVEAVRQAWRVFAERGIEGAAEYFSEDCLLEDFQDLPDRAPYGGGDGLRERFRHFTETWDNFVMEPMEFIGAGGDVVVVVAAPHPSTTTRSRRSALRATARCSG